jgi:hypothetical protein
MGKKDLWKSEVFGTRHRELRRGGLYIKRVKICYELVAKIFLFPQGNRPKRPKVGAQV